MSFLYRIDFRMQLFCFAGTLGGLFSQILQGEDIVRERAIKFLSTKLKTLPDEVLTKEVEELILTESKKVSFRYLLVNFSNAQEHS